MWQRSEHGWGAQGPGPDPSSIGYRYDGVWVDGLVPEDVVRAVLLANDYERQAERARQWLQEHPDLNGRWFDDIENDAVGWAALHDPLIHACEAWFVENRKDPSPRPVSTVPFMAMFMAFRDHRRAILTTFAEKFIEWRNSAAAVGEFAQSPAYAHLMSDQNAPSWPESKTPWDTGKDRDRLEGFEAYVRWADAQMLSAARSERKLP